MQEEWTGHCGQEGDVTRLAKIVEKCEDVGKDMVDVSFRRRKDRVHRQNHGDAQT